MPISGGSYVSPTWTNDASPAINAAELQAITDTLAVNGAQTLAAQTYKAINDMSALNFSTLANSDYFGVADVSATSGKKITVVDFCAYLQQNLNFGYVEFGSYVGTGTFGSSNPNTVSFTKGSMKLLWLLGVYQDGNNYYLRYDDPRILLLDTLTTTYASGRSSFLSPFDDSASPTATHWAKKAADGTSVSWYMTNGTGSASAKLQYNTSGATYYWVALG